MRTSQRGVDLIKRFESLKLEAYQDGGGVWTIGYGHTGPDVTPGRKIDEPLAEAMLREDLMSAEKGVKALVQVPLTQSMFDALVSFAFNVGVGALKESKLLVELNRTAYLNVPEQLTRWKWDNGKPVRGLLIRRLTEGLLFLQDGLPDNAVRAI